ncbi:MAG: metallophosphoesterase family protein [Pirellulaceae bacterium]
MSGRLIAIGDIHGCTQALDTILATIGLESDDTFVTLGDYVDRGPDSKGVIDRLIALRSQCNLVPLFGNHEEMMLDVVRDGQPPYRWLQYGGVETLDSYRFAGTWMSFLRSIAISSLRCSTTTRPTNISSYMPITIPSLRLPNNLGNCYVGRS